MNMLRWMTLISMVLTNAGQSVEAKHHHDSGKKSGHVRSKSSGTNSIIQATRKEAQRAFVITFVRHEGFLLMKAIKKAKGEHLQLPGGRIDEADFVAIGTTTDADKLSLDTLVRVGKHAALRELFEETGIDLKGHYERLEYLPGVTKKIQKAKVKKGTVLNTDFPRKLYYFLTLHDDEYKAGNLTLSHEHVGFVVEPDIVSAAEQAKLHSGGDSARALQAFHDEMEVYLAAA